MPPLPPPLAPSHYRSCLAVLLPLVSCPSDLPLTHATAVGDKNQTWTFFCSEKSQALHWAENQSQSRAPGFSDFSQNTCSSHLHSPATHHKLLIVLRTCRTVSHFCCFSSCGGTNWKALLFSSAGVFLLISSNVSSQKAFLSFLHPSPSCVDPLHW